MGAPVARLPQGTSGDDGSVTPVELYKNAVEEYRFQAQFNWSRTQYMLVFNTGLLAVASAVASRPGHSAALIFGLGIVACVLSWGIMRTQHDYYRAARKRMTLVEEEAGVPERQRVDSTATLGKRARWISVTQLVYLLLTALAVADGIGVGVVFTR